MSQKMSQKRASNYSSEEIEILIHEVRKQKKMLFASFNNNVTNQKKTDIWKDIAAKLNAGKRYPWINCTSSNTFSRLPRSTNRLSLRNCLRALNC